MNPWQTNSSGNFQLSAKMLDAETGNYYYGARYYNPKWSLWLSVDPLAERYPGWSPYNYTLYNPVRFVDPDGRSVAMPDDWYEEIGSGNIVWYDGSRDRAGYEKLPNGTNVIDGQAYQLQDEGVFVNLATGRQYGKGDKITGPSGFSITSHGAAATYFENMKEGISDTWNSPLARTVVPDKLSISLSSSITAFLGMNTGISANWITRGHDADLTPYMILTVGAQGGLDVSADALIGGGIGYFATSDLRNIVPGRAANSLKGWSANVSLDLGVGLGGSATGSVGFKNPSQLDFAPTWIDANIGFGASIGAGGTVGASYSFPMFKSQFEHN